MAAQKTLCGSIQYFPDKKLGKGAFGSVYEGSYNEEKAAVKIVSKSNVTNCEREVDLQRAFKHENVLKLLTVIDEGNAVTGFRYIVLELCAGTLEQFIKKEYTGPMPSDREVLYQIACGVHYIHSMPLIHRDIKPDNILISCTDPVVMKVSDFGMSKPTSSRGTFDFSSGIKGTENWMAPEILMLIDSNQNELAKERATVKSDIFALGCVFFYFLKKGIHPFGNGVLIPANILQFKPVNKEQLSKEHFAYGLIEKMIQKVEERIGLTVVIQTFEEKCRQRTIYQFKAIERSFPKLSGYIRSRFHPTDPVLACGSTGSSSVTILKGASGSVPFSNWKIKQEFKQQTRSPITTLEWNVNGTQLVAGCLGTVIVWSYPSGDVLFEDSSVVSLIAWNPFRQDVFATRDWLGKELLFWNSRGENGDARETHQFLTLKHVTRIRSVAWVSANQIAIGLHNGQIEIFQINEDRGTSRVVKQFGHSEKNLKDNPHFLKIFNSIIVKDPRVTGLQWDERTKYLASSSTDGWIKIWSMNNDQPVHILQVHDGCRNLAWRRNVKTDDEGGIDGERKDKENFIIACGLKDGLIVIWNPLEEDEAKRKRILPQKHSTRIESLSFSPDGRFLESTSDGGELILWSTETWMLGFTCQNDGRSLSWMSTDSSSVPAYKLAVESWDKVRVIEQIFTD